MSAFSLVIFAGLLIRIILIGNPGFLADVAFWKSWSLAASDHGIVWTVFNTNINYPPGFIYVLWLMGKIYALLGNPYDYNTFWAENNFLFLLVSKSFAIVADTAIAFLIYWFFSQKENWSRARDGSTEGQDPLIKIGLPTLLASVFYLNPVVILDSALWGQVESLGIFFTLVAVILLFYKKPTLATVIFTTGVLMKLQNIIFIPLYFLFIFRYFGTSTSLSAGLKTLAKSLVAAGATFLFISLPFAIANNMDKVFYLLTVNNDYFPWLSLNAHNLWWIVAGTKGMTIIDKITVFGILNAKTVGLLIFSTWYFLLCLLVALRPTPRNFLLALTLSVFAFFLFTTQSHERYSYPVLVLLLFFYPFTVILDAGGRTRKLEYFWILYALLTITIFFNIHTGLVVNYPQNGFLPLTRMVTSGTTTINSYLLILLFFLLLPFVFSQISKWFFVLCFLLFVSAIGILNLPYYLGEKLSLTSFTPVLVSQDFGSLQINKAVNSYSGWKSWNRLSNNYFYYRKGFGTHANSNIVFDVNKKFSTFATDYGVDTEAPTPASVIFKIYGDGKELFTSSKMGRFDFPQHIEVGILGVKYLGLVVSDAGDGINSDHADWLNPVLYK